MKCGKDWGMLRCSVKMAIPPYAANAFTYEKIV